METIQKRIETLQEIFKGDAPDQAVLLQRVSDLYDEALGEKYLERGPFAQMVASVLPLSLPGPFVLDEVEPSLFIGDVNQFSQQEQSSACTSCAQCFLSHLLASGPRAFAKEDVNAFITTGKKVYDLLYISAKDQQELAQLNGGEVPLFQALSHYESAETYHLQTVQGVYPEKVLPKEGVTAFFEAELETFQELYELHGNLGFIIHCQGKTCAVAIVEQGGQPVYFLFDSHGSQRLNGNKNAFIVATRAQARMAQILSAMYPFQATDRFIGSEFEISEHDARKMEADNNSYVAYPVTYRREAHPAEEMAEGLLYELRVVDAEDLRPDVIFERELEKIRQHKLSVFATLFTLSVLMTVTHYRKPLSQYIWRSELLPVPEAPSIRLH